MSPRNIGFCLVLALSLPLAALSSDVSPAADTQATKEWTILVFLNADNNLDSCGVDDINEMETVGSTDKVNIVVQLDREGSGGTWRYLIKKDNKPTQITSPKIETLSEQDMGSPATLKAFLEWGMSKYPAKRYFVDIWNHGAGWEKRRGRGGIKGVSYDDQSGNNLTIAQVGQVMREIASANGGKKIDILGYDACLMQMAECAGEVTDSVLYQIASEETEPGDGWPYDGWLSQVVAHPEWDGAQVGKSLVEAYTASYDGGSQGNDSCTLSIIDLARFAELSGKVDAFTQALLADPALKPKIVEAAGAAQAYAEDSHKDLCDFIDNVLAKSDANAIQKTGNELKDFVKNSLVLKNGTTGSQGKSTGLAIWIPRWNDSSMMQRYGELKWAAGCQWDEFLTVLTADSARIASDLENAERTQAALPDVGALASGLKGSDDLKAVANALNKNPKSGAVRNLLRAMQADRLESLQ